MVSGRVTLSVAVALLFTAAAWTAVPVSGGKDVKSDTTSPPPLRIQARPPIQFNAVEIGRMAYEAGAGDMNGTAFDNFTGLQRDVYRNLTLRVNVSDLDTFKPNIANMNNITFVGYVNFEGDPGRDLRIAPCTAPCYDKKNYEFQFNATRVGGGGSTQSYWDIDIRYPTGQTDDDDEIDFFQINSSWVNETDRYKISNGDLAEGQDGITDTLEIRWGIRFGNQSRHTNASGPDSWNFYGAACDIFGQCNDTKPWGHTFDLYAFTALRVSGNLAGRDVPGGGPFKLDTGAERYHRGRWVANNNFTAEVNATNFTADWPSSTLKLSDQDAPPDDPTAWTKIGPENTTLNPDQENHPWNGTTSKATPGEGEGKNFLLYWACGGIPSGVAGGIYTSTVTYRIVLW